MKNVFAFRRLWEDERKSSFSRKGVEGCNAEMIYGRGRDRKRQRSSQNTDGGYGKSNGLSL